MPDNSQNFKITHGELGTKSKNYVSIYQRSPTNSMFKKILSKLKQNSDKIKVNQDVNAFEETEKKGEDKSK